MSKTRLVSSVITPEIEKWLEKESAILDKTISRYIKDLLYEKMQNTIVKYGDSKEKDTRSISIEDAKNMF